MEKGFIDRRDNDDGLLSGSAVPPEVLKKTRAVLLSCTKGVLLKSFGKDYCHLSGMNTLSFVCIYIHCSLHKI